MAVAESSPEDISVGSFSATHARRHYSTTFQKLSSGFSWLANRCGSYSRRVTPTSELLTIVEQFENGLLPLQQWHHREHLIIAVYYLTEFTDDDGVDAIRQGIQR